AWIGPPPPNLALQGGDRMTASELREAVAGIGWRGLLRGIAFLIALRFVTLSLRGYIQLGDPPPPPRTPPAPLLEANGKPLAMRGGTFGLQLRYDDLPRHLVDAVIAIEDRRFFDHPGIDLRGVLRALRANVQAGQVREGGSTITQQLAKIAYVG